MRSDGPLELIFAPVFLAGVCVIGFLVLKRSFGRVSMRRVLIWYAFACPFSLCVLAAGAYRQLRWLDYVALAVLLLGFVVLWRDFSHSRSDPGASAETDGP